MLRVAFRVADRRPFARFVCWWQRTDTAHCEVAATWGVDGWHECISSSWLDGGVRAKRICLTPDKWRVYEVPGDPDRLSNWLALNTGRRYDWLGLLGFGLRRVRGFADRVFCSEAVAEVLGADQAWRFDPAALEQHCRMSGRLVRLTWPDHLTE